MNPNVGNLDRWFRIALGLVVIGLGIYFKSWWGALGAIPLLTGLVRWCPLYVALRTSTLEAHPKARA